MKTILFRAFVLFVSFVVNLPAATPIKDLVVSGSSQQASGTFTLQTGVTWTAASGSTVNLSAATLTLATDQIGWVKVAKSGSSLADLATRAASDLSFTDDVRITFNPGATNAGINVGGLAGDPSAPSNGDLWYDSTANELTARINGANVALGAGGGGGSTFTGLTDTPASFSGQTLKVVRVNAGETALEFTDGVAPGWVSSSPDAPPASPDAQDDEFDDAATLPGGGSALWSWVNQGGATATLAHERLILYGPATAGDATRVLVQTAPATPWTITVKVTPETITRINYQMVGIVARESGTGKLHTVAVQYSAGENVGRYQFTSPTAYSGSTGVTVPNPGAIYLRLTDNGTNLVAQYSRSGSVWHTLATEGRTAFMAGGADEFGVYVSAEQATHDIYGVFDFFRVE